MGIFDFLRKKAKVIAPIETITPVEAITQHTNATSISAKYNMVFVKSKDSGRGRIRRANDLHENDMLMSISDIHISECEHIIDELDNALQGKQYEEAFSFDWADLDLDLKYPNVELYDVVISMVDFRLLLLEWVDFNRKHNKNIL